MERKITPHILDVMSTHTEQYEKPDVINFAEWIGVNALKRMHSGKWYKGSYESYSIEGQDYKKLMEPTLVEGKLTTPEWDNLFDGSGLLGWWD